MRHVVPIICLVIGLAVSVIGITTMPIWHDEAITLLQLAGNAAPKWPQVPGTVSDYHAYFSGSTTFAEINAMLIKTDVHPPVYYYIAKVWGDIFGSGHVSLRVMSLLCAAAAAVIAIKMIPAREPLARATASIMLLLSPTLSFAAINARDYGLTVLLGTALIALAQKAISDREGKNTGLLIVSVFALSGLSFLTHYFSILVSLPAVLVLLFYTWKGNMRVIIPSVIMGAAIAALSIPFLVEQFGAREGQFAGYDGWIESWRAIFMGLIAQFAVAARSLHNAPSALLALATTPILCGLVYALLNRREAPVVLHTTLLVVYCIGLHALFYKTDKSLAQAGPRYIVFALPSLAYLIGRGVQFAHANLGILGKVSVATVLIAIVLFGSFPRINHYAPSVKPWNLMGESRSMKNILEEYGQDDILVIMATNRRGNVGRFSHALPPNIETRPLISLEDAERVFDVQGKSVVIVVSNESSTLHSEVQERIEDMEASGFEEISNGVWVK